MADIQLSYSRVLFSGIYVDLQGRGDEGCSNVSSVRTSPGISNLIDSVSQEDLEDRPTLQQQQQQPPPQPPPLVEVVEAFHYSKFRELNLVRWTC